MVRPRVAGVFSICQLFGLASTYLAADWRVVLGAISAPAFSLVDTPFRHQGSHALGRLVLHFVSSSRTLRRRKGRLERAQEVDDILLLFGAEPVETSDDLIRLTAAATVCFDSRDEVGCPTVTEKENALPDTPEWRCSEFVRLRRALRDAVPKTLAHVVEEKIGEEVHRLVGERSTRSRGAATRDLAGGERWRVTGRAACRDENSPTVHDGRRIGRGGGRTQHPHKVGKRVDV